MRKQQKVKAKNSCKNQSENKKSSNFFAARRKYYGPVKEDESCKSRRQKKKELTSQLLCDQSYFDCVKLVATFALSPAAL